MSLRLKSGEKPTRAVLKTSKELVSSFKPELSPPAPGQPHKYRRACSLLIRMTSAQTPVEAWGSPAELKGTGEIVCRRRKATRNMRSGVRRCVWLSRAGAGVVELLKVMGETDPLSGRFRISLLLRRADCSWADKIGKGVKYDRSRPESITAMVHDRGGCLSKVES